MTAGTRPNTNPHGIAFRGLEDRYVALRRSGYSREQATASMGLSRTTGDNFESAWRLQTHLGQTDASSPLYDPEKDERLVSKLRELGGFSRLSEVNGRVALPLVWR